MFWNPRIETMPYEELKQLQYHELKQLVNNLYSFNKFYHDRMREANVSPLDINCLDDIRKLPFMYKQDLRDNYPDKMFTAPKNEIVRYHVSSGTSGKPTLVAYTRHDLDYWTEALARSFTSAGIGPGDIMQVSYGYGLFTGGLGAHYGAEKVGATVLPASTGNTQRQLEMMQDLGVTVIACTPSYLTHLCTTAREMGIDWKRDMKLKKAILGAEPWSESMRTRLQNEMGIKCYDIYGTSEQAGPMFSECEAQKGAHICGDLMLVEILDRETGEPLEPGNEGEMVVTMLQKEAMPMIRYKMKDITHLDVEPCECGRTSPRIGRITGRADDMLIIRGINVFPSQIEYTLMRIPQVGEQYMIYVTREGDLDRMQLQVEIRPEAFSDKVEDMVALRAHIESELKKYLNVAVEVELKAPGELPRFDGKAKRVIDKRVF
ncbi:Phenylacetate-coenzyme A ligase [Candidatus Methanomethylophilus alvi Mx1201]|jgi:phenylacetate-CoA ligase|uniref:Phenylacetate-coenzyme A ligase n=3 Tax=Methanomethylophilus alvi TaxID=1291540 RepID=M9SDY9_METAX|nr:phenylacetate--CoA ligase [Methanomethylophilus alvi]CDF30813.1 phenylacetate--CoA ligase [Methanoculleus sp. CAG:1088]AGI85640.2 Phenylacetate-coenzyme A ligase [Candidatus Methanomethylophilus alvi Mx1201]AYQ55047.1 phenylacetate--CoA ligase [Methanomethylophilus alvi]MCI5973014.1 phenylacetate--CoA ligase [Methanomethylophilus alvi]MDD7481093.1 phenylacetate--CoA ligase [Methanomethylophilus alvi]